MKKNWWLLGTLLAVLFALCSGAVHAEGIREGQPFPNLAWPSMEDGRAVSIANFRGKKTVLHIWASW